MRAAIRTVLRRLGAFGSRLLAFTVILSVAGLAALGVLAFRNDLNALEKATKETILWSAAQLEFELSRFVAMLAEFAAGAPGADARAVNTRFDVLWSRIQIFSSGDAGHRLSAYDGERRAVARLFETIKASEAAVVALDDADRRAALALLPVFRQHMEDLRQLSLGVLHGEEKVDAASRQEVRNSAQLTALFSLAAVAIAILSIIVFSAESRRFRRLAAQNLRLAENAERSNAAKSRFLTMMSHELRTPMNGVLGLLALAKQPGLPRPQLRLLEQAERSGIAMIEMLSDMLDFSELQDERLALDPKPFALADLAAEVERNLAPVGRREGVELRATVQPGAPVRVVGDFARLRQAISHLATYLVETAGTRGLELLIQHDGKDLIAHLSFRYGEAGAVWRPDLVLGTAERGPDQFASDALGPAVARMLVTRMKGAIRLDAPADDRVSLVIRVPAAVPDRGDLCIRIETRSTAIGFLCRSAVSGLDPLLHTDGMPLGVDVVLYEAGRPEDEAEAKALRARFPKARIVAIGTPTAPAAFDAVSTLPIDPVALREIVSRRFRLAS